MISDDQWPFHFVDSFLCCTETFKFDVLCLSQWKNTERGTQGLVETYRENTYYGKALVVANLVFTEKYPGLS